MKPTNLLECKIPFQHSYNYLFLFCLVHYFITAIYYFSLFIVIILVDTLFTHHRIRDFAISSNYAIVLIYVQQAQWFMTL